MTSKWPLSQRAGDMQQEHNANANADRDAQEAGKRRMSVTRIKRAVLNDDAARKVKS